MSTAPVEHRVLQALVDELDEGIVALGVAGVAFPDPDLPDDLRILEDRLRRAGASDGAARVGSLAEAVGRLAHTDDAAARRQEAAGAFEALQALVVWVRSFREALSLEVVKARLARASDEAVVHRRGEDLEVCPLGAEEAGGRLLVHTVTVDGAWLVLADQRSEVAEDDPLRTPAVSRLFQERVALADVLSSRVQLRDHPVVRTGPRAVARPAFHTRPRLRPREQAPEVPIGVPDPARGPVRIHLVAARTDDGDWRFTGDRGPVSLTVEAPLRRALERRAAWEGTPLDLDAVVLGRGGSVVLLQWRDALGEPAWPTLDPRAVRRSVARLVEAMGEGPLGAVGRSLLAEEDVPEAEDLGVGWRAGAAAVLTGRPVLAVSAAAVFVERAVAGEDTFGLLWPAVWTVLETDGAEAHRASLEALREARLAVPLSSEDDWDEVCLRARLHHALSEPEGDAPAGAAFLEAHLATLRRRVDADRVPEAAQLWALADTRAVVRGAPRGPGCGRALGLPLDPVRDAVDGGLLPWLAGDDEIDADAIDALLVATSFDLGGEWWV